MSQRSRVARLTAALDDLAAAYEQAQVEIEAMADPGAAFSQASEVREQIREHLTKLEGRAADLRARMVGRIYESERMSLAVLAERIGASKARADQLLRASRRGQEPPHA